jgi:glycosyltransferase involved in cell wall biosynthesis
MPGRCSTAKAMIYLTPLSSLVATERVGLVAMRSTVCLNMIVKNEARTIGRCLQSVLPFIDTWVIVDTGSTDGTQTVIRETLKHLSGELHERPWKNFGHNRTEALRCAEGKSDFILLCDADMALQINDPAWRPSLDDDGYYVRQHHGERTFSNVRLINARLTGDQSWCYRCSTHEYIDSVRPDLNCNIVATDAIEFLDYGDGGSKSDKYTRDAALLEQELRQFEELERGVAEANATLAERQHVRKLKCRAVFYLAQTYRDMDEPQKSLETYQRRASMGGWDEEVWYARLEAAKLSERLGLSAEIVTHRYLQSYNDRPKRAEPLVELARFHRLRREYVLAHLFAQQAKAIPEPDDILFIDTTAYRWRGVDEYAVASYWVGQFQECAKACGQLLNSGVLPPSEVERVAENLTLAREKLQAPDAVRSSVQVDQAA